MFDLSNEQTADMKAKTFKGICKVLAQRAEKSNCERGIFIIIPDRENVSGYPVVSFVGVRGNSYATSLIYETWRDVIMEANEAGLDFAERMMAKGALAVLKDSEKAKIYEAVDHSGSEANAAMFEHTNEGQVIVCIPKPDNTAGFYVADTNAKGYPTNFDGKELELM